MIWGSGSVILLFLFFLKKSKYFSWLVSKRQQKRRQVTTLTIFVILVLILIDFPFETEYYEDATPLHIQKLHRLKNNNNHQGSGDRCHDWMNIKYRKKLSIFIQFITIFTPSSPFNSPRGVVFSPLYRLPFFIMVPVHTFLSWVFGKAHTKIKKPHRTSCIDDFLWKTVNYGKMSGHEKLLPTFTLLVLSNSSWRGAAGSNLVPFISRWNFYVTILFPISLT